jgi:hypothetical protein
MFHGFTSHTNERKRKDNVTFVYEPVYQSSKLKMSMHLYPPNQRHYDQQELTAVPFRDLNAFHISVTSSLFEGF